MKGNPSMPQCGFSRAAVQILELHGVPTDKLRSFDVLEDSTLRSDVKEFSYVSSPQSLASPYIYVASGQPFPKSTSTASSLVDATFC